MPKKFICLMLTVLLSNGQVGSVQLNSNGSLVQQITTNLGHPIGDLNNMLTVGEDGPALLQDSQYIEAMAHFDRERIPERVAHAKGTGAFGTFVVTDAAIGKYSKANVFASVGKETDVAVRLSVGISHLGSADTQFLNVLGMGVKFYTEQGNWDSTCINAPQFLLRDASLVPSFGHVVNGDDQTNRFNPNSFWDLFSQLPEALATITHVFSDAGIPDGYRHMDAHAINAFRLVNRNGSHVYAKFHWLTNQGVKNLTVAQSTQLSGTNPDYSTQDLFDSIANGQFPSWTLWIQVITEAQARSFPFNPFDATKYWPTNEYPLIKVGVLTLNRNIDNHFAQIEQMALDPGNLVPGIEPSPDKLLAGRMFAYPDTQRYRLGTNFDEIPVNRPKNSVGAITQRNGGMRVDGNYGSLPGYFPNSFSNYHDNRAFLDSNFTVPATTVFRYEHLGEDNYLQPRELFNSMTAQQKQILFSNAALALSPALPVLQQRFIDQLNLVHPAYGAGVSTAVNALLNPTSSGK